MKNITDEEVEEEMLRQQLENQDKMLQELENPDP
jgi:hypothetical protein